MVPENMKKKSVFGEYKKRTLVWNALIKCGNKVLMKMGQNKLKQALFIILKNPGNFYTLRLS